VGTHFQQLQGTTCHNLRRQFHNLMSTVEIAVKGAQVVQQPFVSVQAPIQPTGSTGYTNDVIPVDVADHSNDVSDNPPSTARSDFAGMVKLNRDTYDTSDGFTTVSRKKHSKPNKKKVTVGDSAGVSVIKGVAKKAVVCVNRLELGTSVDDVESHLHANNVSVISCFALENPTTNSRPRHFTAMRLCIPHVHLRKVYDASIWPVGVVVRPWTFKTNAAADGTSTSS